MSSYTIWSSKGESKLKGIGPTILFLGLHPVMISAYKEYVLLAISTAGKCVLTEWCIDYIICYDFILCIRTIKT